MSMHSLPILLINLNGEMLYILEQRLRAQNIAPAKIKKVLLDMTGVMFNKRFIDEVFKPQEVYPKKSLRAILERFAHASVMRLNPTSMEKLNDLMIMAVKYQVFLCKRPQDLLLITLNHVDEIRKFMFGDSHALDLLDHTYLLLHSTYSSMLPGTLMMVRQRILVYLQDCQVRVSIFLRDKVQHNNTGRFVLPISGCLPVDVELPGKIRLFSEKGEKLKTLDFNTGAGIYTANLKKGSYNSSGDRVETLGTNMYITMTTEVTSISSVSGRDSTTGSDYDIATADPRAKAQLDLLSHLIGSRDSSKGQQMEFHLNLFSDNADDDDQDTGVMTAVPVAPANTDTYNVVHIDASKKKPNEQLERVMADMRVDSSGDSGSKDDDDLLALMDSAAD